MVPVRRLVDIMVDFFVVWRNFEWRSQRKTLNGSNHVTNRKLGKEKPVIGSYFFLGTPVSFQSLTGGYQLEL